MRLDRRSFPSRPAGWILLVVLPLLVGCPEQPGGEVPVEALPFAGQDIHIGVPAEMGFRAAWEGPLNEWEAQSGAKCHLDELPTSTAGEPVSAFSRDHSQTLALFPLERSGELIAAGRLTPIPASLLGDSGEGLGWQDLFQGLREKVASRKGEPMFMPLSAPVLVCYYRADLLRTAELNPPQTWDDYQQLLEKLEVWAPGCTALEPWSSDFRATMFLARAVSAAQHPANYSLYFDIDTGDPLIDGPAFVKALSMARSAVAKMPGTVLKMSPAACRKELLEGRAALVIAHEPSATDGTRDLESRPASNADHLPEIGVIRLPGSRGVYDTSRQVWEPVADKGVSYVTLTAFAGRGIGASAGSSKLQIDAAWNALLKISGQDFVSGFPPGVVGLCRESQLSGAHEAERLPGEATQAYATAVANSLRNTRLVAELPVEGRDEFRRVLADSLGSAIDGSKTPESALQDVAVKWREIITRIGPTAHRDNYRSSLGLSRKRKD